ncbi:MAG: phycobiliprotein lyase [Spirulinaceae cyanobacterium RM2_2_10]|nr:phycobiliprotein lyase [Spirulinaceae cyanobacterium SM2_1_0]NJO20848.1 phycobiliprotein lyase [Spirulinaceae cyanobacterium RM2_2_10]
MDGMEFFRRSAGTWRSQRTTHHLPFRRAESGGSAIQVESLAATDPRVAEICQLHNVEPAQAAGGAFVSWDGAMAWDKEGEEHKGTTVFALIPDPDDPQRGQLLRERGYAEIVPVAGQYVVDAEAALNLVTEYETMSVSERFWFASPDLRLRTSTVQRFGGFSTATFCAELRVSDLEAMPATEAEPDAPSTCAVTGW